MKGTFIYVIIITMPIYWQKTSTEDKPRHPSLSWANWKNWAFVAWNRDTQAEEEIKLPSKFFVVAESWSIKGYLAEKWWVYSNEIYSFPNDVLTVRSSSWEILYEWLWADIKDKIKSLGLKLIKNVHYIDPKKPEELRTFCIKGAALKEWMETFSDENRNAAWNNFLSEGEVKEWKTWAVTYTFPSFKIGAALTEKERAVQQEWGIKLLTYTQATITSKEEVEEKAAVKYDETELPF